MQNTKYEYWIAKGFNPDSKQPQWHTTNVRFGNSLTVSGNIGGTATETINQNI